jgi:hypothetical protein
MLKHVPGTLAHIREMLGNMPGMLNDTGKRMVDIQEWPDNMWGRPGSEYPRENSRNHQDHIRWSSDDSFGDLYCWRRRELGWRNDDLSF